MNAQPAYKDGDDPFLHNTGMGIAREPGSRFPLGRRATSGYLVRHHWPHELCSDCMLPYLKVDVSELMPKHPETDTLVLAHIEAEPCQVTVCRRCNARRE